MPFVQISVSADHDAARVRAIADGVHEAMTETIGVPAADRFQLISRRGADEMMWDRSYLEVSRSEKAVFVNITLSAGRDDDAKRALYARIVENLQAAAGVRPEDVLIVLTENTRVDWSFGEGVAQYVPGASAEPA